MAAAVAAKVNVWPCPKTSGVVPEAFLAYIKKIIKVAVAEQQWQQLAVPISGTECIVQG